VAALKWVLKNPQVDTTIPSMTDMEQLDANFKAMSSKFSEGDQRILSAHLERIGPLYCRMCGHCEGTCSQGLRSPTCSGSSPTRMATDSSLCGANGSSNCPPGGLGPLPGLLELLGRLPPRSARARASQPRPGAVRVKCFVALLAGSLAALGQTPDCSLVPGWTQQGASAVTPAKTSSSTWTATRRAIWSTVSCHAGRQLRIRRETIVFDVSEMADAESAYGMFTATRDPHGPLERIGMGRADRAAPGHLRQGQVLRRDRHLQGRPRRAARVLPAIESKIPGATEPPRP